MQDTSPRQEWLDLLRGLSAIAVCAGHLRGMFFVDYSTLVAPAPWQSLVYLATGLGRHAVMVFFVLSGYFVGGSLLRQRAEFTWPRYLHQRLSRLWTVLLPALCVTALLDACTVRLQPEVLIRAFSGGAADAAHYSSSLVTFLGNMMFLQTVLVPKFGSNGPLWSLANEFWYYLLFPLWLEALGLLAERSVLRRCAALAACATLMVWLPRDIVNDFAVWLLGVGLAVLPRRFTPPATPAVVALGLFALLASMAATKAPAVMERLPLSFDILAGLGGALLVLTLLRSAGPRLAAVGWCARWSSEISYSLYLVHFPLVVLVSGLLIGDRQLQLTPRLFAAYLALLACFIGIGWAFWWLFERNTARVRRLTQGPLGLARA